MVDAFIWWLTIEALGLVALPLAAVLMRPLPDRGYAVSKVFGLLLVGWLAYLLAMVKLLPFGRLSLLLCLLLVAGVSAWLLYRHGRSLMRDLSARFRSPRFLRYVIASEALFLFLFAIWALFRSYGSNADIWATEKFMDFGFMNSILKSGTFPPNDMWLSGHSINYYYFGYVLIAALTGLSGVRTEVGFNLANCTLLALTALGSFSLVYNLVVGTLTRRASSRRTGTMAAASQARGQEEEVAETQPPEAAPAPLPSRRARSIPAVEDPVPAEAEASLAIATAAVIEKPKPRVPRGDGPERNELASEPATPRRGRRDATSDGRGRERVMAREHAEVQGDPNDYHVPLWLSPYIYAIIAALMVVAMGNLTISFATKSGGTESSPEHLVGNGWQFCFMCQTPQTFNWWNPSRVILDYKTTPSGKVGVGPETINEFPAFSFLLADMHPHVMALPLVLLALSAAYAVSRRKVMRSTEWRNGVRFWLPTALIAIILGSLYTANTWDYPTYLIVLLACLGLPYITPAGRRDLPGASSRFMSWFSQAIVIVALSLLAFLPFHLTFKSLVGGTDAVVPPNIASIPILGTIVAKLGGLLAINDSDKTITGFLVVFGIFIVGLAGWLIYETVAFVRRQRQLTQEGTSRSLRQFLLILAVIVVPLYVLDILLKSPLLLLLVPMIAVAVALIIVEPGRTERNVALILFAMGAIIGLTIEFIFLRDVFGNRINTLFKFYYQMWILWGLAAGYGLWRALYIVYGALNEGRETVARARGRTVEAGQPSRSAVVMMIAAIPWVSVFALLVLSGLLYSIYGPINKASQSTGQNATFRGLNGIAHMNNSNSAPDDYQAILWLKENGKGSDVVVECCKSEYNMEGHAGRVSAFTGVPTILSWDGHESQWRGGQKNLLDELPVRRTAVNDIYQGIDPESNQPFTAESFFKTVDKYNVDYIFVGAVERGQQGVSGPETEEHIKPEAEAFYKSLPLPEAFRSGDTVIYRVPPKSDRGGIDMTKGVQPGTSTGQGATPAATKPAAPTIDVNAPAAGLFDFGKGQFNAPRGIARDAEGNFYVADTHNLRIEKFDPKGKFITVWGSKGDGPGQFNPIADDAVGTGPGGVAVDKAGNVYVADTWNHRVQKFDKDGKYISSWGTYINLGDAAAADDAARDSKFYGPRGLAIGPDGNAYVTDTGNKRVLIFKPDGTFVSKIDSGMSPTKKGPEYPFSQPGELNEPIGIAVDGGGNVYVADTNNHRIQKFDPKGKSVAEWPIPGTNWNPGPYLEPFLALDSAGNLYATAPSGSTVLKFGPDGKLLGQKNSDGTHTVKTPTGIWVDPDGAVYVVDTNGPGVVNLGKIP